MDKKYYVYIMTNKWNTTLYVGMTNDIVRRVYEHKNGFLDGFTKKYRLTKLVYAEEVGYVNNAIEFEKKIKGWTWAKKKELINRINPQWKDLGICPCEE